MKKAYQVTDDYEGNTVVVFAKSSAEARRLGGNELGCEWEGVDSCRRVKQFDQFHWSGKVPSRAMLDAGWWITCFHTGQQVYQSPEVYISDKDTVFRDFKAYEDHLREQITKKITHLSVIRKTRSKFPFAEEIQFNHGSMLHPDTKQYHPVVTFRWPGGERRTAQWLVDADICFIAKCDLDAWNELNEKHKRKLP